ncbi:MAG: hypothetical protein ACREXQ_00895 [Polaromonas sp.]
MLIKAATAFSSIDEPRCKGPVHRARVAPGTATAAPDDHAAPQHVIRDEDVARLSPLLHDHINMLGRYSFNVPEEVRRGELRALRDPNEDLAD